MTSKSLEWTYIAPNNCVVKQSVLKPHDSLKKSLKKINKSSLKRPITYKDIQYSIKLFSEIPELEIPSLFSLRSSSLIELPIEQGDCGSCWAVALCSVLGDRYSIKYNIKPIYPSPLWLMANTYDIMNTSSTELCNYGGDPYYASIKWLEPYGTKIDLCWPYYILSEHNNICPKSLPKNCCYNGCNGCDIENISNIIVKAKEGSTKNLVVIKKDNTIDIEATTLLIQKEILINGPVISCFQVYNDFEQYWNNYAKYGHIYVFNDIKENLIGGHAVVITGWGEHVDNQTFQKIRYWEVRNSWGIDSGDNGYFKVAFSSDIPANINIEFDIPAKIDNYWSGGVMSIEADILPESIISIGIIPPPQPISNKKNNILIILIIISIFIIFLIIIGIFLYNRHKKSISII